MIAKPWMPKLGSSSASITVAARLRTAPPTPTSRPLVAPSQSAARSSSRTCSRSALSCFGLTRSFGRNRSVVHDGAEPPRARVERAPLADVRELHRAAADVERDAVGQRRRVHGGEVAEPRLLLAREHLDREPGALAGLAHELLAVARLADRRRGERPDPLDPRRAAEVREQLDRLQRALHRLGLERPVRLLVLADAHRLVDLVRPLPPLVGVGEDDEPERVRAEVDDGEARRVALGAVPSARSHAPRSISSIR